jgi:hypothetical protein
MCDIGGNDWQSIREIPEGNEKAPANAEAQAHAVGFEPPTLGSQGQIRIVQLDVRLPSLKSLKNRDFCRID